MGRKAYLIISFGDKNKNGMEEYWRLKSEKGCDEIDAYLDIPDDVTIGSKFTKQLKDVHKNYLIKYLLIKLKLFESLDVLCLR